MTQTEISTNENSNWDDFVSARYLKAEDIKEKTATFVVIGQEKKVWDENERPRLCLSLEHKSLGKVKFDCNVTNANFLAEHFPESPNQVIGANLKFEKVRVFSPHHKKEVDSWRITEVVK